MAAAKPVRKMRFNHFKVFSGNANPVLAKEICYELGCQLAVANVKQFSDGEVHLQVQENVRGADVFVVQPTCRPVDTNLMELLLMMDALKRASAERITALLPYYGYARQDRKDRPRMPISARLVASLIERAGADRVLALDLHAAQIQGFSTARWIICSLPGDGGLFQRAGGEGLTVVSRCGGVERARAFAKRMDSPLAIIDKRRTDVNVAESCHHRRCIGPALSDRGRFNRHGGHAGEGHGGAPGTGREKCSGLRNARGVVGSGGRQD
jgi:ribose-phosphate pyrophosphokinase